VGADHDRRTDDAGDCVRPVIFGAGRGLVVDRAGPQQHGGERLLVLQVLGRARLDAADGAAGQVVGAADLEGTRVPTGGVEVGERDRVHSPGHLGGVAERHRV
jgi:hypothetical protein